MEENVEQKQQWEQGTTVAAIATPPGVGGVAMVRISGARAYAGAASVFRPTNPKEGLRGARGNL